MPATKNLCAQISLELHQKISDAREQSGLTTAQYITNLLMEYYEMKENGGNTAMTNNKSRTLAFQIEEDLFQRIKAHLERESARTGRKLTQREFVLGLIEEALDAAERQADSPEPEEQPSVGAGVGPCGAQPEGCGTSPRTPPARAVRGRVRTRRASPTARTSDSSNRAAQAIPTDRPGPPCPHITRKIRMRRTP